MATQSTVSAQGRSRIGLNLLTLSLLSVLFGLVVSGYLSYVKLTEVPMACLADAGFDCAAVQQSDYAEILGIPIAWLGLATYIIIGALLVFQDRVQFLKDYGMILTFGVVFFAFIYSMYLVYVQGVMLGSWCQWCLMHEANMVVLFGLTVFRLRNHLSEPIEDEA